MPIAKSITLSIRLSENDPDELEIIEFVEDLLEQGESKSDILFNGLKLLAGLPVVPPSEGTPAYIQQAIENALNDVIINPDQLNDIQAQLGEIKRFLKNLSPSAMTYDDQTTSEVTGIPEEVLRQSRMRRRNKKRGE
jgi:hypothetical protein